jgi:chromosome segregation ATPase
MSDERLDRIEQALERIERMSRQATERFDQIDQRFVQVDLRFEGMERSIDRLTQYVLDFRSEAAGRLQVIENRLDILTANVASVELRLAPISKSMFEAGSLATQMVRERMKQNDLGFDLGLRISKLEDMVTGRVKPAA